MRIGGRRLGHEAAFMGEVHVRLVGEPGEIDGRIVAMAREAVTDSAPIGRNRGGDAVVETLFDDIAIQPR